MPIAKRYNFTSNAALSSSNLNTNFDDIINAFNTHTHTGTGTDAPLITTSGIGNGTGFGSGDVWRSFTPSWTNFTVGNGTNEGKYQRIGKTVIGMAQIILGSTSAMGTGPNFTPPVPAASITNIAGENHPIGVTVGNTTSSQFMGVTVFNNSLSKILPLYQANTTTLANITAAAPTAWPATAFIVARFEYEAA
jgi:hypothetical protein